MKTNRKVLHVDSKEKDEGSQDSDMEVEPNNATNGNGNENSDKNDDDDDEMDLANFSGGAKPNKTTITKKRKKGIIYLSNIPCHMNVTLVREILGEFGKIGRVYLEPEKQSAKKKAKKNKRKLYNIHFTEGWVEFESKRVAKQIVSMLNNRQISSSKTSRFYHSLWCMKYLPRFKWVHLTERMNYEQAVHKQRLQTEVSQARKETTFFQSNLDKSEHLMKQAKKMKKLEKSTSE